MLAHSTPPDYVFGYLYIGSILLANARLNRTGTVQVTLLAALLTLSNLWLPGDKAFDASTLANRLIAVICWQIQSRDCRGSLHRRWYSARPRPRHFT